MVLDFGSVCGFPPFGLLYLDSLSMAAIVALLLCS
jgi:hypothetical protein